MSWNANAPAITRKHECLIVEARRGGVLASDLKA